ncbi:MAG: hypothetical protein KME16_04560 [Scytolyngbya sp. HA4215-MV1]|jgi:PAS domain-containing protein|nr:hypothetical protein [Scytolyngbya sp. HA4215-MV1]
MDSLVGQNHYLPSQTTPYECWALTPDITDRKQAEAARLQAEQIRQELTLLEQILDVILAGYWDWDIAHSQEYLSPGFKHMFSYEDNELPNSPETWMH